MQIKKSADISANKKQLFSDSTGKYILYSIPWDTRSEQARWSLDRHGSDYVDIDLPWGFSMWETLKLVPDELVEIPLLTNQKGERFSTVTQITMYLYSQAFSGKIRLYSPPAALDEQEFFDGGLGNAAKIIYLDAILRNYDLTKKYIIQANHLKTWNAINDATWKLMQWVYWIHFSLYDSKTVKNAWKVVDAAFDRVDKLRAANEKSDYLVGDSITAADIAFASHASLLLLPQNTSLVLPGLEEMTPQFKKAALGLLARKAGQFAKVLYEKERGPLLSKKIDSRDPSYSPDWADRPGKLRANVFIQLMHVLVAIAIPIVVEFDWVVTLIYWLSLFLVMLRYYPGIEQVVERGKILYHMWCKNVAQK